MQARCEILIRSFIGQRGSTCDWLYQQSKESCRQHKMPPCPQVIIWLWLWAYLISAPCDLTLAHPGLPRRAPMCRGKSRLLRNTDGVVLSIPLLSGSVSEGVPQERGLFENNFSFISFLNLAIWFCLFLLDWTDRCTLNFYWLYCWTFSVIKNKGSGPGNAGR